MIGAGLIIKPSAGTTTGWPMSEGSVGTLTGPVTGSACNSIAPGAGSSGAQCYTATISGCANADDGVEVAFAVKVATGANGIDVSLAGNPISTWIGWGTPDSYLRDNYNNSNWTGVAIAFPNETTTAPQKSVFMPSNQTYPQSTYNQPNGPYSNGAAGAWAGECRVATAVHFAINQWGPGTSKPAVLVGTSAGSGAALGVAIGYNGTSYLDAIAIYSGPPTGDFKHACEDTGNNFMNLGCDPRGANNCTSPNFGGNNDYTPGDCDNASGANINPHFAANTAGNFGDVTNQTGTSSAGYCGDNPATNDPNFSADDAVWAAASWDNSNGNFSWNTGPNTGPTDLLVWQAYESDPVVYIGQYVMAKLLQGGTVPRVFHCVAAYNKGGGDGLADSCGSSSDGANVEDVLTNSGSTGNCYLTELENAITATIAHHTSATPTPTPTPTGGTPTATPTATVVPVYSFHK